MRLPGATLLILLALSGLVACGGSEQPQPTATLTETTGSTSAEEDVRAAVITYFTSLDARDRCAAQSQRWIEDVYGDDPNVDPHAACLDAEANYIAAERDEIPAEDGVIFGAVETNGDKAAAHVYFEGEEEGTDPLIVDVVREPDGVWRVDDLRLELDLGDATTGAG